MILNINIDYLKCYLLLFDDKNHENIKIIMDISNKYLSANDTCLYPKEKIGGIL